MSETFEQMALRVATDHGLLRNGEYCFDRDGIICLAAAIRDELAKGAEPVACCDDAVISGKIGNAASIASKEYWGKGNWADLREIAKRICHPLYSFPPSAAARIAELEKQRGALLVALEKLADVFANIGITSGLYDDEQDALKKAYAAIAKANEVAS